MAQKAANSDKVLNLGYRVLMKRNSTYIAFVLAGALLGERVVNYGFDKAWEQNNQGKLFKHMEGKLGQEGGGDGGDEGGDDDE
ncbi:hypothetical protein ABBQ32_005980 [Trebouxia sp. C0010 RCD-2024]